MSTYRYKAFISYSHQDEAWANWLHGQLEGFQPPEDLPVPGHLAPIFQDREEMAASRHLSDVIHEALAESEFLIVICSPASAETYWDETILVRYRSRRDFISMVTSDAYQEIAKDRAGGIAYAEVTPTTSILNLATPRLLLTISLILRGEHPQRFAKV